MSILDRFKAQPLEGETGVPDTGEGWVVQWQKYGIFAAVILAVAGFVYMQLQPKTEAAQPEKEKRVTTNHQTRIFNRTDYVQEEVIETPAVVTVEQPAQQEVQVKEVVRWRDPPKPAKPTIHAGRSQGEIVSVQSAMQSAAPSNPSGHSLGGGDQGATINGASGDNAGVEQAHASKMQNLDRTVRQSVIVPCTLKNALNTQLSGMAGCVVSRDVWSADNSRILIGKGSDVTGEYQVETTSAAVVRIGVTWGRLVTTDDQVVNLDSPASDPQGATGIPADSVNYHYWRRFSAAFMVSLIDGAINNLGSNDTTGGVVVNSAANSSGDLAQQIIGETAGMPATRKAHRGAEVAIYLRKDLIFGEAE